ncbi:hypothetical protein L1887_04503 [Cichorium endivia]|nr:hypothetical protein L1887_04503 [Cichorium endivia]
MSGAVSLIRVLLCLFLCWFLFLCLCFFLSVEPYPATGFSVSSFFVVDSLSSSVLLRFPAVRFLIVVGIWVLGGFCVSISRRSTASLLGCSTEEEI